MSEIIPAILADSKQEFEEKLRIAEKFSSTVQIDILDGSMFGVTNWHDAEAVAAMETATAFELHLMVNNPLPIIADWVNKMPNVKRAIIHAEIERPLGRILEEIHLTHLIEAGVSINPETPFEEIHAVLSDLDVLLIMSVHPGSAGQKFDGNYIIEKIKNVKNRAPNLKIEVDGGVTANLIPNLQTAGATRFAINSALFKAKNKKTAWKNLQDALLPK